MSVNTIQYNLVARLDELKPKQREEFLKLIPSLDVKDKLYMIFWLTYDKSITYNIKLTTKEKNSILSAGIDDDRLDLDKVIALINYIIEHINSKKKFFDLLSSKKFNDQTIDFTKLEWKLIFKILDRNLNVGYKQVIKHLKKHIVKYLTGDTYSKYQMNLTGLSYQTKSLKHILPYFPFQLADDASRLKKLEDKKFLIQPKLDGIRVVIDREGYVYTRNHEYFHYTERSYLLPIGKQILELYEYLDDADIIFDGEIFFKDFPTTQSLFSLREERCDYDEYKDKLEFYIFDIVRESLFLKFDFSYKHIDYEDQLTRYELLKSFFKDDQFENLKIVKGEIVDRDKIEKTTLKYISDGYEGSVVKRLNGNYEEGRNSNWIKIKPINEIEALVIDVLEGEGRFSNNTGSLLLKDKNGKEFKCSGLTDEQRKYFWENKDNIIGKVVEVKYQELTPDGIPRFPRFHRIREDKTVDNLN